MQPALGYVINLEWENMKGVYFNKRLQGLIQ